jgi:hypothetical protein
MDECQAIIWANTPSPPQAFALAFERLAIHYPESKLTQEEQTVQRGDWLRLLGHIPADIFSSACDAYLMSPARFFPTPGQIAQIAEPAHRYREALARRAHETVSLIQQGTSH